MNILKCPKCKAYTLKKSCSTCSTKTVSPKPPKYSPLDPYAKYRLIYKKEFLKKDNT